MNANKQEAVRALFDVAPKIVHAVGCGVGHKDKGLTFQQIRTIMYLASGPRFLGEIAKDRSVSPASASALVDGLERDGYLTREMDKVDRRRIIVQLTSKGHNAYETARKSSEDQLSELVAKLNDEETLKLVELLSKM